jgi:hypothetical protein
MGIEMRDSETNTVALGGIAKESGIGKWNRIPGRKKGERGLSWERRKELVTRDARSGRHDLEQLETNTDSFVDISPNVLQSTSWVLLDYM